MKKILNIHVWLYILLVSIGSYAQNTTPLIQSKLNGTVVDKITNESIIGASVLIKGTTHGVNTDIDGKFFFQTGQKFPYTLIISYLGYKTQELIVDGSPVVVKLAQNVEELNELVVVGYGAIKKSDITGAVSSLKKSDFNIGANVSIDQMIQAKSSGVQINQTSSEPGGGLSVKIRGQGSLNAGSEPLYVIDGLPIDNSNLLSGSGGEAGTGTNLNPRNPLNSINPNDVESIEILKDASATAIYGSRGANGVILISTKKGKNGKTSITYDLSSGFQTVNKTIDILSTSEYISAMNELSVAEGRAPEFTPAQIASIGNGTDWQKQIYQTGVINSHNISASGGDDKTTFFASLNYFNQDGVVKNTGIEKFIARVNLDRKLTDKLDFGINFNTSLVKDGNNLDGVSINEGAGPINAAQQYDPTEPIYSADGTAFSQSKNLTINNPLSLIDGVKSNSETNRTIVNLFLNYKITEALDAKLNLGSDRQQTRRDVYNSTKTLAGSAAKGIASIAELEKSNFLFEYTMNYKKKLGEKNKINILQGFTYQYFNSRSFAGDIRGFPSDALGTDNLGLGNTNNDNLSSNQEDNTLLSSITRANYSYDNKLLLTASLRADGSSKFGENNKFGYFPSVALAWRLSEEKFIPSVFSDLKLRTSWGLTGNQDIANYASLTTYNSGASPVFNNTVVAGTKPSRIANPDLKWETTEQLNFGIDAGLWKGRVNITADYFIKNTRDLLLNVPLPQATGYSSILKNVGEMQNRGFEFSINSLNIDSKDFKWSTNLNITAIENEVTDLGVVNEIITGNIQGVGNTSIVREGSPAYSYYGYIVDGIFQNAQQVSGSAQPTSKPGYPIFRDVNGDNKITPLDQVIVGNPYPDLTYGIQNTFTYKDFQFSFFIQGQEGGETLNINLLESMYPSNFRRNRMSEMILDRWTPANTDAKWPSAVNPTSYGGGKINSLVLQDASYVRLKNVNLSYDLPLEKDSFIRSLKISFTAQNLYTWTKYIGFDPESSALGRGNVKVDYNGYPLAQTFLLGLNANF
ncbi:SusC/RagA family TonB-linked outer membrane protein [Flavobacterium aquicola]|uniref:TonB-linked SusC/RagA family outer membrane protein n=1 Tax=Flavobacterium aquicola TaxID=1682742 RepID=A0A3E0EQH7_9FLAO|nr:TonB-dependent receptor [Flavobacterium aquicola]REH00473.1 TonB-linked SusC/RagA family outer membrane protein [Flavobacterium aquicola]